MSINYDVIFPFYKDFKYLSRSLTSINNQKLLPKNLIFIDDGNKNKNLKNLLKNLLNSKINLTYISFSKNKGNINGILEGSKYLKSEYFFIMATDDVYYENLALNSLKIFEKYKKAGFVFSNIISNLEIKNRKKKIAYTFLTKNFYNKTESKKILKEKKIKFYHNTVFYRTKYFKQKNYFNVLIGPRCDFYNLIYFSSTYGFVYVDEYLAEFTIREGQINKNYKDIYLIKEIEKIKENFYELFDIFVKLDMFFDISPLGLISLRRTNLKRILSLNLFIKSFYFFLWRNLRKYTPDYLVQFVYKIIN